MKLSGGLGNQLFQYATGRRLSHALNTKLKLDIRSYPDSYGRKYYLDCFNVNAQLADENDLRFFEYGFGQKFLNRLPLNIFSKIVKEKSLSFEKKILDLSDGKYLDGYWQSEKYFKDIESIIRKDITLKPEFSINNSDIFNLISHTNSVSLHVRRADYAQNKKTNSVHGTCSKEYYEKAINKFSKIENLNIFIFSDDIAWAKQNIQPRFAHHYVDHGAEKGYIDLVLMSHCQHHIIANSTFSWWGAWLNDNPNKIVIAPNPWFRDKTRNDKDIIPVDWIKLNY